MKNIAFLLLGILLSLNLFSQTTLSGSVTDANTGEALIGATLIYGKGKGTVTDIEGNYKIKIHKGERNIQVSYVGYKTISKVVSIDNKTQTIDFKLKTKLLNEVLVVADIARDRETPVAFSTISMKKISEELASQDLPMILNTTPGVYATQSGGGDGDARITIRGFKQKNVAVMIDGIPVNDMENGNVYWSNWFGLDAILSSTQVQRGLGASKIAIPSVGGTINYLTAGIGSKKGMQLKQEVGSGGYLRSSFSINSGRLKGNWGYTLAGSYKWGNGYIDHTFTKGYFYYGKLQKSIGKHILSLSVMGAPQEHGQRSYKSNIAFYDTDFANELGISTSEYGYAISANGDTTNLVNNLGVKHNKHFGLIDRWELDENGDTIHNRGNLNERVNYYHKPQFSLRDVWTISDKLSMSNVAYLSVGNGGSTSLSGQESSRGEYLRNEDLTVDGYVDFQSIYDANHSVGWIQPEPISSTMLASKVNNHFWYGWISTLNYELNKKSKITTGLDLRKYRGDHYKEVYDLLGGNYIIINDNINDTTIKKVVGDKVGWHNESLVKWAGIFAQYEYKTPSLSAFVNLSGANTAYKRIDYFKLPELQESNWKWIKGYTIKSGANKNLDEYNNVFFNIGYITRAPRFENVFYYDNSLFKEIKNENIKAIEGGYSFRSSLFSVNTNLYYTIWENKPKSGGVRVEIDEISYRANINGMNALHKGVEVDFAYKTTQQLTVEGLISIGDWRWNSSEVVRFTDENNEPLLDPETNEQKVIEFDATGVHVADAAQTQLGMSLRYQPISNGYIKLRGTYFGNNYAEFDPISLSGSTARTESWKLPSYQLFDLHCGYSFKLANNHLLDIRFSLLNILDEVYISDAQNNDTYSTNYQSFDAKSAGVFFGLGRRYNLSAKFRF